MSFALSSRASAAGNFAFLPLPVSLFTLLKLSASGFFKMVRHCLASPRKNRQRREELLEHETEEEDADEAGRFLRQ